MTIFFQVWGRHGTLGPLATPMIERHGSGIKQLSVAIGMAREQSYYHFLAEKSTSYGGLQLPSPI